MSQNEDRGGFGPVVESEPAAGPGHNSGLIPGNAEVLRSIEDRHAPLFERADELLASEQRIPRDKDENLFCPDTAWEKNLTELVRQIQGANKSLDLARAAEKQPYDDLASAVHGKFREIMDQLVDPRTRGGNGLKQRVERALTDFKERVRQELIRKAEEEAKKRRAEESERAMDQLWADARVELAEYDARKAAEAAARKRNPEVKAAALEAASMAAQQVDAAHQDAGAAAVAAAGASNARAIAEEPLKAPASDLTRARSASATSSLREYVDYRDVDHNRLPASQLWAFISTAEKEKAIRGYIKLHADAIKERLKANPNDQPMNGVEFFINRGTTVR